MEEIKTENFLELMKSIKTKQTKRKPYLNTTYLKTAKEKCSKRAEIKLKMKISNSESPKKQGIKFSRNFQKVILNLELYTTKKLSFKNENKDNSRLNRIYYQQILK